MKPSNPLNKYLMNQYITEPTTGENYIKDGFRRDDPRVEKMLKEKRDAAKKRRFDSLLKLTKPC
jgi:hypothetical protein